MDFEPWRVQTVFKLVFLVSSGALQPKHELPCLVGVWRPDGAGEAQLCEEYDHRSHQADDWRQPGPLRCSVLTAGPGGSCPNADR